MYEFTRTGTESACRLLGIAHSRELYTHQMDAMGSTGGQSVEAERTRIEQVLTRIASLIGGNARLCTVDAAGRRIYGFGSDVILYVERDDADRLTVWYDTEADIFWLSTLNQAKRKVGL